MSKTALLLAVLCAGVLFQRPANAHWGNWGYGTNYYGYGLAAGWYTGVNDRVPPYFALHPPVYYSGEIVRVPYGASPFAQPWGTPGRSVATPAAATEMIPAFPKKITASDASVVIENKFYLKPADKNVQHSPLRDSSASTASASEPRGEMIENVYYQPQARVASRP